MDLVTTAANPFLDALRDDDVAAAFEVDCRASGGGSADVWLDRITVHADHETLGRRLERQVAQLLADGGVHGDSAWVEVAVADPWRVYAPAISRQLAGEALETIADGALLTVEEWTTDAAATRAIADGTVRRALRTSAWLHDLPAGVGLVVAGGRDLPRVAGAVVGQGPWHLPVTADAELRLLPPRRQLALVRADTGSWRALDSGLGRSPWRALLVALDACLPPELMDLVVMMPATVGEDLATWSRGRGARRLLVLGVRTDGANSRAAATRLGQVGERLLGNVRSDDHELEIQRLLLSELHHDAPQLIALARAAIEAPLADADQRRLDEHLVLLEDTVALSDLLAGGRPPATTEALVQRLETSIERAAKRAARKDGGDPGTHLARMDAECPVPDFPYTGHRDELVSLLENVLANAMVASAEHGGTVRVRRTGEGIDVINRCDAEAWMDVVARFEDGRRAGRGLSVCVAAARIARLQLMPELVTGDDGAPHARVKLIVFGVAR